MPYTFHTHVAHISHTVQFVHISHTVRYRFWVAMRDFFPETDIHSESSRVLSQNIAAAGAVDRELGNTLSFLFSDLGLKTGSWKAGRGLKRSLEAIEFILAKFEPKRSHGDPVRGRNCDLGTGDW